MEVYWLWLSLIKGIGPITAKRLLQHYKDAYSIYNATKDELENMNILNKKQLQELITSKSLKNAQNIISDCKIKGINILTYSDELYKERAKICSKSPIVLFYKGFISKGNLSVGIVGARRCTDYGKKVAVHTAEYLAQNGVTVISGMAKGIDSYAHTACLKNGGYTLAFLGSGVDICYPAEHSVLMKRIIENGAVISQFLPSTKPIQSNFINRNYLLSAWCEKLLVVEGTEKSGALTTAKFAKENEAEVYAVPNNIYAQESKGTNKLIAEGAKIYLTPNQLVVKKNYVNINICQDINSDKLSSLQNRILKLLKNKSKNLEEIIISIKEKKEVIIEELSIMEVEGMIEWTPQGLRIL
ncbi:DNA-processing protein DprA [Clostridium estertheticum]|uniref:DNA-processing protein DprA n=1 Tax=Clostridium estertheticum TaxID=238834 RepID=UPI001C6E511E|nr:DNA-processing protein DprA [Clostridium estertheticum]MBW9172913.1 DNA-processing protein DprA [Clostridium estertheticum]WLC75247.1 DNA-processing protein DprA [Clostridium estertheticum]